MQHVRNSRRHLHLSKDLRNYAWDDAVWMDAREKYKDRHQPVSIYETSLTVWKNAQELVDYVKN